MMRGSEMRNHQNLNDLIFHSSHVIRHPSSVGADYDLGSSFLRLGRGLDLRFDMDLSRDQTVSPLEIQYNITARPGGLQRGDRELN